MNMASPQRVRVASWLPTTLSGEALMSSGAPSGATSVEMVGGDFTFIAGNLALDFANTVGGLRGVRAHEYLTSYADLARWGSEAGLFSALEASSLMRMAPTPATEVAFTRAIALREAIHAIIVALLGGTTPATEDMATLNAELAHALAHQIIAHTTDGYAWQWNESGALPDALLWRIARSAADLLISPTTGAVGQCASETCGWLFVDNTRNHHRRWCDMRGCGNRAKVRRHRARRHAEPAEPARADE